MTGSEFPYPINEYGASPPPDNLLPTAMRDTNISGMNASYQVQQRIPDFRRYEIKDHLGNVRTVISDVKNPESTVPPIAAWKYKADVKNISNMYPYGKSYGTNAIYNAAEDYRYSFNGMEKAKEVDENTNSTHFRNLDLDFGGWWSRDPESIRYPGVSPYVSMGSNPILFTDAKGDVLDASSNYHSMLDIRSIVMEKNRPYLQTKIINSGKVEVQINFDNLSKEKIDATLREDKGLTMLYNIINSERKYLYEAKDNISIRSETGQVIELDLNNVNPPMMNASDNGKDSRGKNTFLPPSDYNGYISISANFDYYESATRVPLGLWGSDINVQLKNRNSVVLHEIAENYYRTEFGIDYKSSRDQPGAHYLASKLEESLFNSSNEPGSYRNYVRKENSNTGNAVTGPDNSSSEKE